MASADGATDGARYTGRVEAEDERDAALDRAIRACSAAAERLADAGVAPETLAEYVPPRRAFLRTRPATMRPAGEVWRIGPLLLAAPDAAGAAPSGPRLFAAGRATRAAERGRPGYQSNSREERREIAAAALRGGYPVGTPVNYDATPIELTAEAIGALDPDGPVGFASGELRVRWRAGAPLAGAPTLADFLADRVELLADPPAGAN